MKTSVVPVAAGILGVGVLIFLYLKRREKRRTDDDSKTEIVEEYEFRVRAQQVPAIVGRNSVILKAIEEKTQTQIRFHDSDDDYKICSIKGTPESVKSAKSLIDVEIAKPFVITEELLVPTSSCGKIEGYSGSVLLEICSKSSAKVWVDPASRKQPSETRRVLITGTEEQVKLAKQLIDEKIKEDPNKNEDSKPELSPTSSLTRVTSNPSITATESPREVLLPSPEKLKSADGQLEVFVSAVHSPSRFWVQLVGPQSTELDFLVDAMTEYYSSKENREIHEIREPYLGQIVAAMLLADNKWYRAEIVAIQVDQSMPQELLFDVYFLDYGDKQFVTKRNILELRADFLSLRFQAVECFLAHVQPTNGGSKIDEWDEKAVGKFEELVQPSHWKKLISKVVAYKERKDFVIKQRSKQRESSPVPGVELYDPDQSEEKSIALELVRMGFAELNDEQFGDLRKSSILRSQKDEVEEPKKVNEDEVETHESEIVVEDDKVQISSEEKDFWESRDDKVPINNESLDNGVNIETNNNSIMDTSDDNKVFNEQQQQDNAIKKPEKKIKTTKKKKTTEKLADFLANEQKTTTTAKKVDEDWNEMLDDSS